MARPSKEPPSRSTLVPAVVRYAAARGVDVEMLSLRFALPPDVTRSDEVKAGFGAPDELLQAVSRAVGEDDVALRLAPELGSRRETLVGLAVRAMADGREALAALARWMPLLHEGLEASLEEDSFEGRWVLRTPRRPRGAGRFVQELVLARALHLVRSERGSLAVARLWFAHARPAGLGAITRWFGTEAVAFGCEDSGFALGIAELARPMPHPDARTVEAVGPLLDAELGSYPRSASLSDRVATHLASSLPGSTDVAEVAAALHMSARTLQRRLEQEGTRFGEMLDRARLDRARRLLADPSVTLTDAAYRLGFADLATFSRAFRRWTGKPPGQWRRS
ncbi:MAG TPA: helix-turn-helix domain-containing protein [Polyangiaceae bacterium]|jgi:AraC-like DNA-binding protein